MPRKLNPESKLALEDKTVSSLAKDVIRVTDSVAMGLSFDTIDEAGAVDSAEDAADFLVVNRELENRAFARYLKLKRTVGKQLADSEREYRAHAARSIRLFEIVVNGLDSEGAASPAA